MTTNNAINLLSRMFLNIYSLLIVFLSLKNKFVKSSPTEYRY